MPLKLNQTKPGGVTLLKNPLKPLVSSKARIGVAMLVLISIILSACTASQRARVYSTVTMANNAREHVHLADNLFYVGSSNTSSFLLDAGQDTYVLFDAGYDNTPPIILKNIRALGLDYKKISLIANTHTHFDHAAGLRSMQKATKARLYTSKESRKRLQAGGKNDFHFLRRRFGFSYEPPEKIETLEDAKTIIRGDTELTMHETPGHARGCTSWSFKARVDGVSKDVLLVCGLRILPLTKFSSNSIYPDIVTDYERTFVKLRNIPCDILLTPHAKGFGLKDKARIQKNVEGSRPFVDPAGCKDYLKQQEKTFCRKRGSSSFCDSVPHYWDSIRM